MPEMDAKLFDPCPEYSDAMAHWELPRDLLGETLAMRDAGIRWLPKEPRETKEEYSIRLNRSVLFGAFPSAVRDSAARSFKRSVVIREQERLSFDAETFLDDVDLQGTSVTEFCRSLYEDAAGFGVTRILVEWDEVERRPFWRIVRALDLPYWERAEDGRTLLEARIAGVVYRPNPERPGLVQTVETRRRYMLDESGRVVTDLWGMAEGGGAMSKVEQLREETPLRDRNQRPIEEIPLIGCYFNRDDSWTARPPYEGLAWLNLRHWQTTSDQANILRYARVPVLAATGVNPSDLAKDPSGPRVLKAGGVLGFSNENAKLFYVEPSGEAIQAGQADIEHVERQMERAGAKPDARRAGVQTATGQMIDEAGRGGYRAAWSRSIEKAVTLALWWSERWLGVEMDPSVVCNVQDDEDVTPARAETTRLVLDFYKHGLLTRATALQEGVQNGVLSEGLDIELESELARQEYDSPIPGMVGVDDGADDDPDDEDDDDADMGDDQ